jgi:hypothetical protein
MKHVEAVEVDGPGRHGRVTQVQCLPQLQQKSRKIRVLLNKAFRNIY